MTKKTRYEKDVLKSARGNHVWLNAFSCINPTKEFLEDTGREVVGMLDNSDNLILSDYDNSSFAKLKSKELILRINKS
jgi:hypothetical protein